MSLASRLPLAAIILFLGSIPRTAAPSSDPARSSLIGYLREHWQGLGGLLAAMCSYSIGLTGTLTWAPVYIIRALKGSAAEVGMAFGVTMACASVLSVVIAGVAVRRLSSTTARWRGRGSTRPAGAPSARRTTRSHRLRPTARAS